MSLPNCDYCGSSFKWTTIFRNIWGRYKPITCVNCESENHLKSRSRVLMAVIFTISMFILGFAFASFSFEIRLLLVVLGSIFISFFIPYLIKYEV
ncbi:TIGR04104 family putative zinc finger protein [Pseudalkalibacillus sp. SCS-8]|uniref:TIGR04104 family putative zinc finger protein n=1 Tax=Pseudalkalibacillus nanhaiensis TaxID=3115291 RepID=UPI0039C9C1DC